MLARTFVGILGGAMWIASGAPHASAQVNGRVVLASWPIGASIVFGSEVTHGVAYRPQPPRPARLVTPLPARYRRGMTLAELGPYLERIEHEYDLYRRMHPDDAYYYFGWSRAQLRDYVAWLKHERRFLRNEHRRLTRLYRAEYRVFDGRPGRGAPGRGRGVARGNPHR